MSTTSPRHTLPLPQDRLEAVDSWGGTLRSVGYVWRPSDSDGIREVLQTAREHGLSVGMRGSGLSYGDASQNREEISLNLSRMNRILAWDAQKGILTCEPGVTLKQIWQHALGDGWWPYVVSGTMFPTIGGAASMNIHGKNHFHVGTIGEHIREFDLMLPSGEVRHCSRDENADLFHAAIGGFGMLGVFTSITLELKKIYSGLVRVEPVSVPNWRGMFQVFEERLSDADYMLGWVDCFATGADVGRGQVHLANDLKPGADSNPAQTLRVEAQAVPDTVLEVLPKSALWRWMKPFTNDGAVRAANAAKYHASRLRAQTQLTPYASYHFMLDYVPNWKRAYGEGGLMQYQTFVPKEHAERVFARQIALCQSRGLIPYLGVFKRHRPDPFWMSYSLDGYSLALDFKMTASNRSALYRLAADLDRLVIDAGGRFYFAKDSTLHPSRLESYRNEARVQKFLALKGELDPENRLQTDLYRRLFGAV